MENCSCSRVCSCYTQTCVLKCVLHPDALQEHSKEELDSWKIVRVSEDFRVIALGLPVPKYKGNPLDPPLRSRFQARDVYYLPFKVSPELYTHSILDQICPTSSPLDLQP